MGVGEVGALGHEHDVGQGHEAAPQAHGRAVDGGHDRDVAPHHAHDDLAGAHERLAAQVLVLGELVEVVESPPAEKARPLPVSTTARTSGSASICGNSSAMPLCSTWLVAFSSSGLVEAHDAYRAVGLDVDLRGQVVVRHVGSPRIRRAMRLRWICDVPPMTLWDRLYR